MTEEFLTMKPMDELFAIEGAGRMSSNVGS